MTDFQTAITEWLDDCMRADAERIEAELLWCVVNMAADDLSALHTVTDDWVAHVRDPAGNIRFHSPRSVACFWPKPAPDPTLLGRLREAM